MTKRPDPLPTSVEQFLYLLFEMERVVEGGRITWPVGQAEAIRNRLAQIAEKVAPTQSGDGRGS
jgi:hypothetical protein